MKASDRISGLHHITAIAGNAQRNHDFYTRIMGLRMVKKTINFDDPGTYHFYFGDETGTPGTLLTFFPWNNIRQGRNGAGMATEIAYSVPAGSLPFWKNRFETSDVRHDEIESRFGKEFLSFTDPDGLQLTLIADDSDDRKPWESTEVKSDTALRGFNHTTLTLNRLEPTAKLLTDVLGYEHVGQEENRHRFATDAVKNASIIDILEAPGEPAGLNAGGTNHHIAFRVKNDDILMEYRTLVEEHGLDITPKVNRDYFFSLYFREPGGVLFELATDNPGFMIDETKENLGSSLRLPQRYEAYRERIEAQLPKLQTQ